MSDTTDQITEARRASRAIYLATDPHVARDVSRIIVGLADALEAQQARINAALAQLDSIEDRAPHDSGGRIYMHEWAQGIISGSKAIRRILSGGVSDTEQPNQVHGSDDAGSH